MISSSSIKNGRITCNDDTKASVVIDLGITSSGGNNDSFLKVAPSQGMKPSLSSSSGFCASPFKEIPPKTNDGPKNQRRINDKHPPITGDTPLMEIMKAHDDDNDDINSTAFLLLMDILPTCGSDTLVDLNAQDLWGWTALHSTIFRNRHFASRILIANGANLELKTKFEGYTPLHLACKVGNVEIVKILAKKGVANIEAVTRSGETPLHLARNSRHRNMPSNQQVEMVQILIANGANLEATNIKDKTPLQTTENLDVRRLLLQLLEPDENDDNNILNCMIRKLD